LGRHGRGRDHMVLDLQLLMQSVPLTTNIVSSNSAHGKVYSIQHYVSQWFSPGTPVSSTNKTDCHDITVVHDKKLKNVLCNFFVIILKTKCWFQILIL
jgi:hypothetical protein